MARTLESRGLITRTLDRHDARAKRLAVTPDGEALAYQAMEQVEAVDDAFFTPAVIYERDHGTSWEEIGERLDGITR